MKTFERLLPDQLQFIYFLRLNSIFFLKPIEENVITKFLILLVSVVCAVASASAVKNSFKASHWFSLRSTDEEICISGKMEIAFL